MKSVEQTFLDSLASVDLATAIGKVEDIGWEAWAIQPGAAIAALLMNDTMMLEYDAATNQVIKAYPNNSDQLAV